MVKGRVLFVIPAYNESLNIKKVLNEIKKEFKDVDIVVVNDCSTDKTKMTCKTFQGETKAPIIRAGTAERIDPKYGIRFNRPALIERSNA